MPVSDAALAAVRHLVVEKNVLVPTRNGSSLAANVFLPSGEGRFPVICSFSPYGKDRSWEESSPRHEGVELGPFSVWETPDPQWWAQRGYALVRADVRGTGASPGRFDPLSRHDQEDYYDLIEWAASQPWSTGKVGLSGISYYAIFQWLVAALQPPHLAAIVPWEGMNDLYREWAYQGGIYGNGFTNMWWHGHYSPPGRLNGQPAVDWRTEFKRRPFDDQWYRERSASLSRVTVPLLSAGNWGAFHLHLRGNVEGFTGAASRHKRLVVHTGTHIDPYYSDWGRAEQLRFLDRWLKGLRNGAEHGPPVRLAVRRGKEVAWRDESEWPLARTSWRRLYLDASSRGLDWHPAAAGSAGYPAPAGAVAFETPAVDGELELTGPMMAHLWLSSSTQDADLFVTVRDIGPDGEEVTGTGPRGGPVPMAVGWLRASHRELDPERSLPYRPYHRHRRSLPLRPGEPVELDVEIWPTSLVLMPGHRLRLEIAANDEAMAALVHNDPDDRSPARFAGQNRVHTGHGHDSYVLVPVISASGRPPAWRGGVREVPPTVSLGRAGRLHVRSRAGAWAVEVEGYGEISRQPTLTAAVAYGRAQAAHYRSELIVHEES